MNYGNAYINRLQEANILELLKWFPVVSLTGPRQSGKSTLLKNMLSEHAYVNLEDPQTRGRANDDPVGFIRDNPSKLIIDEAQLAPELFSMVQTVCDENREAGQYVLSGSQNFLLLKQIGQSLAGRVGIAKLFPLSYEEISNANLGIDCDEFMFQGGYPQLYSDNIPRDLLFQNYIETYVERDVAGYLDVRNKQTFTQFLRVLAHDAGKLINASKLSNELDVSFQTVKSWLSILESSYITFYLTPYRTNSKKKLTKTSKVYFWDTGLLCYLLGFDSCEELLNSQSLGEIYENFIVSEIAKKHINAGKEPSLHFYRDDSKREIDLLDFTDRKSLAAYEIKSSRTYRNKFAKHLKTVGDEIGVNESNRTVICRVAESYISDEINVCPAKIFLTASKKVDNNDGSNRRHN